MNENYFIIHGSFGSPFGNWFSWLQDFISSDGKQVYVPQFPIGVGYQNYENWSKLLKYYLDLGLVNENTTIIAHSIAPVFISKFLTENKIKVKKFKYRVKFLYIVRTMGHAMCYNISKERETNPKETSTKTKGRKEKWTNYHQNCSMC